MDFWTPYMKEKVASITAQRERKTETGANAISTFICHASEELETSSAQELWLPAASQWPGELLGGTREASFPLKAWTGVCRHARRACIIQNAHHEAVSRSPVPQPQSSSQPLHQANVLWSLHSSSHQRCGMSHSRPEHRPRFLWWCGGSAMLIGAEMRSGDKQNLQRSRWGDASPLPCHRQGPCSPFLTCLFFFFLKPTSAAPFSAHTV